MFFRSRITTVLFSLPIVLLSYPLQAASFFSQVATAPPAGVSPLHHQLLQLAPGATPEALRVAFDYRGDVTLTLEDGDDVEGYVTNLRGDAVEDTWQQWLCGPCGGWTSK